MSIAASENLKYAMIWSAGIVTTGIVMVTILKINNDSTNRAHEIELQHKLRLMEIEIREMRKLGYNVHTIEDI